MSLLIWLYRLLWLPVFVASLPYYSIRMLRRGGYGKDFHHRLGFLPRHKKTAGERIWIQAVSVGEILAIGPLLKRLSKVKGLEIVLTTTTSTGYKLAREKYSSIVNTCCIFPIDAFPCTWLAWNNIRPTIAVLMESEVWPEHLRQAKARKVPVILVNARMSDRTYFYAYYLRPFFCPLLHSLAAICTSDEHAHDRFEVLTGKKVPLKLTGNLKFDLDLKPSLTEEEKKELLHSIGFLKDYESPWPEVILGSSTWPGEEETLIQAFLRYKQESRHARLLLIPRHAERREEIRNLLKQTDISWHLRSSAEPPAGSVDIYVADTTGELRIFTQLATVAFIGKTLPPNIGGQTPIEAAAYGIPILFGPNHNNFRLICAQLISAGAALPVPHYKALPMIVTDLLKHPERLTKMAEAAAKWHQSNLGATKRTIGVISNFLPQKATRKTKI